MRRKRKMDWKNWRKLYSKIEENFSFSYLKEIQARNMLSEILGDKYLREEEIKNLLEKEVYITGFSPSLEKEIEIIPDGACIIAADDSATLLHEFGMEPKMVITDLDGDISKLIELRNTVFGIHAHGDNMHLLHYADSFPKRFGTTQIEPVENVYNFGGFTDGDRAVFIAWHFGAKIHLVGFDFENPRIKEGKNVEVKRKKLRWAKYLIEYASRSGAEIIWESLNSK